MKQKQSHPTTIPKARLMEIKAKSVFISYSHKDKQFLKPFHSHLSSLSREGLISTWFDGEIGVGQYFDCEIDQHLAGADIIVMLLSSNFVASEYCYGKELTYAIKRMLENHVLIVPIIIKPFDTKGTPFERLQLLPKDAKAVSLWKNRDEAWVEVVKGIRKAISPTPVAISNHEGAHEIEEIIIKKSNADFNIYRREFEKSPPSISFIEEITELVNGRYSPFAVLTCSCNLRMEQYCVPYFRKRIQIEHDLRVKHKVSFPESRTQELKMELYDHAIQNWKFSISFGFEKSLNHLIACLGSIASYKEDELIKLRDKYLSERPDELLRQIDDCIESAVGDTKLNSLA